MAPTNRDYTESLSSQRRWLHIMTKSSSNLTKQIKVKEKEWKIAIMGLTCQTGVEKESLSNRDMASLLYDTLYIP